MHPRQRPRARAGLGLLVIGVVLFHGILLSSKPAHAGDPGIRNDASIEAGGLTRHYRLFTPTTVRHGAVVPLVLVLHSLGHTVGDVADDSNFDALATQKGFAVAYPQGLGKAWNAGVCCSLLGPPADVDDVGFLQAVIDSVSTVVRVDRHRIYLTGFSNGAMMALRFACEHPDEVAAVASVAGTLESRCAAARPVSVIMVRGALDSTVPFEGSPFSAHIGAPLRSVPATLRTFATIDGCLAQPQRNELATALYERYVGCARNSNVELVDILRAGHIWAQPGNSDYDSNLAIWNFFKAHSS